MFEVINEEFYWSMNDENHCAGQDPIKIFEFCEKTKGVNIFLDKIVNHLFNTNDEVINYLFTEKNYRTEEALPVPCSYDKFLKFKGCIPINNSYFVHIYEKQCKKIDAKNNNIVAFITNILNDTKIEIYLSETNFSRYYFKIDKIVPVVVFNLPEYAQDRIYNLFYSALKRLYFKAESYNNPQAYHTNCPIANAKKREGIFNRRRYLEELYHL